jgi:hypothetical protein
MPKASAPTEKGQGLATRLVIQAARLTTVTFRLIGTAPYVANKFSEEAKAQMRAGQEKGGQKRKGMGTRQPKDFKTGHEKALHRSREGWVGMPATAFRNAMISACRLVGFKMTIAKLSVFVEADGYDPDDRTPLVKIVGKYEPFIAGVRQGINSTDLRVRPIFDEWHCDLRVTFDEDQFSVQDVANLLNRAGTQVGIGAGRHDSKESAGMGWGMFRIAEDENATHKRRAS